MPLACPHVLMTKLSSFLVFAFGIFVIVAVAVMSFKRTTSQSGELSGTAVDLPQSKLPPLELGSREQFTRQIDNLFATGGMAAVRDYVEAELAPGRVVIYGRPGGVDVPRTYRLIDREMRRCDPAGATLLDKPPILARAAAMLRIDDNGRIETWRRLQSRQPYSITVWWSEGGK